MALGPELVRLPNGVRIALDPMPGLLSAAVGVWIRVGARHERAEENGLAHLFEHMAFKGAGARDARQLAEAIEAVGGVMNASTSYERTTYYARVLGRDAAFALDLLSDIVWKPHWAPGDLELEKGVVAQERGEAFDQPDDRVFELHQGGLFAGQPLGRPVLGEAETVAGLNVAALEAFREAHYTPDRVVIAAAGAFDRAAVLEVAEARFGGLAPKPGAAPAPASPLSAWAGEARRLEQTHLVLSRPAPASGDDALYAARLFTEIYGGGMASRLFQEVREKRGLAYAIDAYLDVYEDAGRLVLYAGADARDAGEVATIAGDILGELAAHGPSAGELARAKAVTAAQMLMGAEGPAARAEARAAQVFLRDALVGLEEIQARVEQVSAQEVQAAAAQALAPPLAGAAIGARAGLKRVETAVARLS